MPNDYGPTWYPSTNSFQTNGHECQFPIQSRLVGIGKVKENEELRGDVPRYVAQATPQFDAEIAEKGHLMDGN